MIIPGEQGPPRAINSTRCAIGRASKTKVNANMGASPVSSRDRGRSRKTATGSIHWGADTVMDLSTGGDLDECREAILQQQYRPHRHGADLLDDHRPQTVRPRPRNVILQHRSNTRPKQGVDYFTIHAGVLQGAFAVREGPADRHRQSRGGSLLAKWMIDHNEQNPMYTCCGNRSATSCESTTSASRSATASAPAAWPMRPT